MLFSPPCPSLCHDPWPPYFFLFPHPALPSTHTNAVWSSPKSWASCDQSTGWSTKHFSVFVTGVSPGSTCICSSSLLKQPCKPPEGLPPSVSLGPSTEHSRGWTASGDFLPLPHHLVTQTPRPRNKAGHYPLKTYETHHLPSFLSQVSQLCCKWSHMKDTHRHIHTYIWNIYTYTEFFFYTLNNICCCCC